MAATIPSAVRRTIGVASLVAATILATVGGVVALRSPSRTASAPPASLAVAPSTLAPRVVDDPPATTPVPSTDAPVTATTAPPSPTSPPATSSSTSSTSSTTSSSTTTSSTTTTLALSPLNSLVGEPVSAQPVPPRVVTAPVAMTFDALGLTSFPVAEIGVVPDGQLEIPEEDEIGWYRLGAAPGQPGATVLAAHVSWHGADGPFLRLAEVEPGARLDLALADGTTRSYQVVERAQYGKLMLPRERIWTRAGDETLVLITCGGAFNPDIRRYADNIVLFAVPVA